MIKKAILATTVIVGVCGLGIVLLRPSFLPQYGQQNEVRKRAEGYWNARLTGDQKQLVPFIHPLQAALQENTMLVTKEYEITKVEVKGDKATVAIKAKYDLKMAQASSIKREVESNDEWVRYNGQWYHALHPVGFGEVLAQGIGKWKPPTAPPQPTAAKPAASVPVSKP